MTQNPADKMSAFASKIKKLGAINRFLPNSGL